MTIFRQGVLLFFIATAALSTPESRGDVFDWVDVKDAVEDATFLNLCPNPVLRDLAGIDVPSCKSYMAKFSPVCWHIIEPVVGELRVEQSEEGKRLFYQLVAVYSACIRSEILREIIDEKRNNAEGGPTS